MYIFTYNIPIYIHIYIQYYITLGYLIHKHTESKIDNRRKEKEEDT